MRAGLRPPVAIWAVTSVLLVFWASRTDAVIYLALLYIGLNGGSLAAGIWRDPAFDPRTLQVLAWCTAFQLPTLLVVVFDVNGNRRPTASETLDRSDPEASRGRAGRPSRDSAVEPRRRRDRS